MWGEFAENLQNLGMVGTFGGISYAQFEMIVKFSATNYRSIRDRIDLSLAPTKLKDDASNIFEYETQQLLKTTSIYGPNASGKSAILSGLRMLRYLVIHSARYTLDEEIRPYEPYKLDRGGSSQPVQLELEFFSNRNRYLFRIAFSQRRFEWEELFYYPNGTKALLYSRLPGHSIKFGEAYKGAKKSITKLLLENQLFISKAAENNSESLVEPFRFFARELMVFARQYFTHESDLHNLYSRRLAEDSTSKFSRRFNKLIRAFDTGIANISAINVDWSKVDFKGITEEERKKLQEKYKYEIRTMHPFFDGEVVEEYVPFDLNMESTGTVGLLPLGGAILDAIEHGRVLIVDEFEANLHPSITKYLINLFQNPRINKRNAQLVFATHDVSLLSSDVFRRDQVWLTEKNEFGATSLFRCSDIKGLRLGTPLEKYYTSGKLGGTPIINDLEFILEMQSDDEPENQ